MKNRIKSKLFSRKFAVILLCVFTCCLLSSCTIYYRNDQNPSRKQSLQTLRSYKDGVRLDGEFKGGKMLYGRFWERYDDPTKNSVGYEYYVKAKGGEVLQLDLSAFGPTRAETTDSRYTDSNGDLIPITYPTTVSLTLSGFPGEDLNKQYYKNEIGSTGSTFTDTFKVTIPEGTNNARILFEVNSFGVFNLDSSYVNLTRESNVAKIEIFVNPPADKVNSTYTEAASNGGDSYVKIPVVVAVGALSAVTAACGAAIEAGKAAAAASGTGNGSGSDSSGNDEGKKDEDDSGLQMVVSKDFGSSIKRGAKPVTVYARIQETAAGGISERPDLTPSIAVACEGGLKLASYYVADGKMAADVYAEEQTQSADGVVAFTFNGEGGSFTYRIVFTLVGDPEVRYVDGDNYRFDYYMPVVRGDGGTYEVKFFFDNVTDEPKSIVFDDCAEFDISFEPTDYERTYLAKLKNNTTPVEKAVFSKPETVYPSFKAVFPNGDEIESSFRVELYPEGLNVTCHWMKKDRILINAMENKDAGDLDYKIQPTEFDVVYATSKTEGGKTAAKLLGSRDVELEFGEIVGEEGCAADFARKFKFKIDASRSDDGIYYFCPETILAQAKKEEPFYAKLPVTCTFGEDSEETELPLVLEGEIPPPGPTDWEKEYELLKKTVEKFGLSPNGEARKLLHSAKNFTANELCAIRRAVIVESNLYYAQELAEWQELDRELGQTLAILNTVKFLGDQAFAYLVTTYGGGPMVEAFATPMKDMFAEWAGEYISAKCNGGEFTYGVDKFYNAYMTGCENAIVNMLTGEEPVSPGKIKWLVAAFLMINYTRHYALDDETKGDIFKSLLASFGDISVQFVKAKLGDVFKSLMDKKVLSGKTLGDLIKKFNPSDMFESAWRSPEIAEKYFTEVLGLAVQSVYNKASGEYYDKVTTAAKEGFSLEFGTYIVTISNVPTLIVYLVGKGFEVLFDCVKELIPSTPKPIYDLDCHNYYRPSEIAYRYEDDSTGPRNK